MGESSIEILLTVAGIPVDAVGERIAVIGIDFHFELSGNACVSITPMPSSGEYSAVSLIGKFKIYVFDGSGGI